ncbi:hypothetical protein BU23DRAFT_660642 [Bimuria novae-zelandiae CBS 107.79]|uniref:Uncharacterized protein n=1 Tax=Bimuria novae-zelandiae CBS 107.79 TaxID=1447943 RepID=A0A6A5UT81_9PLEO|nr:hypothetical protein BU23DRAFT_660642 [Bimuria novae-zelandiae CBS 107.79]
MRRLKISVPETGGATPTRRKKPEFFNPHRQLQLAPIVSYFPFLLHDLVATTEDGANQEERGLQCTEDNDIGARETLPGRGSNVDAEDYAHHEEDYKDPEEGAEHQNHTEEDHEEVHTAANPSSREEAPLQRSRSAKASRATRKAAVPTSSAEDATMPSIRSLLEKKRDEELAWQKRELARQAKARERRAAGITNQGFFYKGRWIKPEVKTPFIVKVEGGTEGTKDVPIEIGDGGNPSIVNASDTSAVAHTVLTSLWITPHDLLREARIGEDSDAENNDADDSDADNTSNDHKRRDYGLDITTTFDRRYPLVAEMVENEKLDEQDDAGSLCDFVTLRLCDCR